MTWFKIDDKAHDHQKFWNRSLAAVGLWALAGSWCGDNRTDGFVPEHVLRRWNASKKIADELVEAGLWERAEVNGVAGWQFHDWSDWQPQNEDTTNALARRRWARKNALSKNRALCDQIVARDGGLCRYCGVRVNWNDKRGARGATYDHVDPDGENTLVNVVVACRRCNGRKKDRTPDEAGMVLLPPGTTTESQVGANSGVDSGADSIQHLPPETGRSQVGAKSDLVGPGQIVPGRVGSGRGRPGPRATPDPVGTGPS